jgi:hypothetical protein
MKKLLKRLLVVVGCSYAILVIALPVKTILFNGSVAYHSTNTFSGVVANVDGAHYLSLGVSVLYNGTNNSTQTIVWRSSMDGMNNWSNFDTWTFTLVSNPLPVFLGPTNYSNLLASVWQVQLYTWAITNTNTSSYDTNISVEAVPAP